LYIVYKFNLRLLIISKQLASDGVECVMCYNFATVKRSANTPNEAAA
jgi:hypothetical protein